MQMIDGVGVGVVSVSGCLVSGASGGRRTGMMSSPSTWQNWREMHPSLEY
jgi:hypothetical protein